MAIRQISVFCENRKGKLAQITKILADAKIDIRAFSIADTTDFGILRLIVNDPQKALDTLSEHDVVVSTTQVIAVRISDQPGAMHNVLSLLDEHGVDVEYAYAFLTRKCSDAFVILRIDDVPGAVQTLQAAGVQIVGEDEVYSI